MINKETAKVQYTTVADQSTWYAVDFEYFTTPATGLPQLKVLLGGQELTAGTDYVTGPQGIQLVVAPTAGVSLVIERDIPFTQEIDFQMGLIDPEKIERGLDESVMRDQELATGISDLDTKHDSLAEEVEEVRTVAEGAAADAASAKQVATDAASAAESASEKADEAKTAADNAGSKAQEALDLANSYDTRITTAQNTADSAKTTADQALAGLAGKQDKGDYATKTELTQGLAGKADTSVTDALRNDVDGLDGQVSGMEEKIPADASSSNQLATKADLSNIDALPSQAGNEGKFLTTDGTNASWAEINQAAVVHDDTLEGDGTDASPLKLSTSTAAEISAAQSTADKADNAAEVAQQTANLAGQEAAQALSALAGKVNIAQGADNAGKVMTVGADGNLAPTAISIWPSDSDYLPVSTTLNANESKNFHLSCNLGALEDGVYEFYYRFIDTMQAPALPYPAVTGWQQWLVHLTIKDGEVFGLNSGTNNDSYCMPLPDTDNVGNANQPYGSTGGLQLFCGKSGGNFYVEGAYNNAGFINLRNNEAEQVAFTAAYVTKIKNINTGAFVAFANVALVDNTVANIVNESINDVNPYNADVNSTIQQYFTTSGNSWSPLDEKYFSVCLGSTLTNRPLASNNAVESNSFPKKATICFYTTPQSDDYLEFDVYGSPTQVKITNVRKGGIFSDVVFANYYDTNDVYAGYLYLSKADGTNFQNTTGICSGASWYGQNWNNVWIELRSEILSSHTFIENLTPEDGTTITTDATLTGTGTAASPLGVAQSIKDSIDGKVSKSGDTMTGTLSVKTSASGDIIKIGSEVGGASSEISFLSSNGGAITVKCVSDVMSFSPGGVSFNGGFGKMDTGYRYTLPDATGTLALTSDIPDVSEFQTASQVTTIADTQADAAINSRFLVVDELPAEPDANTFYFIKKA